MAAKNKSAVVAIPEFKSNRIIVEIVGISSLLCNRIPEDLMPYLPGGEKEGETPPKDERPWKERAMDGAYVHPQTGSYVFPSSGLMNSLANAGYRLGLTSSVVGVFANIQIPEEWIEIQGVVPAPRRDMARNSKGALIVAVRAEFPEGWWMQFPLDFTEQYGLKKVGMIIEAAGFGVGIGCWRPECKGTHGRYALRRKVA